MNTKVLIIGVISGLSGLVLSVVFYGWELLLIVLLLGFANKVDMQCVIKQSKELW